VARSQAPDEFFFSLDEQTERQRADQSIPSAPAAESNSQKCLALIDWSSFLRADW